MATLITITAHTTPPAPQQHRSACTVDTAGARRYLSVTARWYWFSTALRKVGRVFSCTLSYKRWCGAYVGRLAPSVVQVGGARCIQRPADPPDLLYIYQVMNWACPQSDREPPRFTHSGLLAVYYMIGGVFIVVVAPRYRCWQQLPCVCRELPRWQHCNPRCCVVSTSSVLTFYRHNRSCGFDPKDVPTSSPCRVWWHVDNDVVLVATIPVSCRLCQLVSSWRSCSGDDSCLRRIAVSHGQPPRVKDRGRGHLAPVQDDAGQRVAPGDQQHGRWVENRDPDGPIKGQGQSQRWPRDWHQGRVTLLQYFMVYSTGVTKIMNTLSLLAYSQLFFVFYWYFLLSVYSQFI